MSVKQRNALASFGYIRRCSNTYLLSIPTAITQLIAIFYGAVYKVYARGWNYGDEWGLSINAKASMLLQSESDSFVKLSTISTLITEPNDIRYCGGKIFIKAQSTVFAAGDNLQSHRLGLPTTQSQVSKLQPLTFPDIKDGDYIDIISNGHDPPHTLFITNKSKTVYGIGTTCEGALGGYNHSQEKGNIDKLSPIPSLTTLCTKDNITKIECGQSHTVMLTKSGNIWCCGCNSENECGILSTNETDKYIAPTRVMSDIVDISAGASHTLCLSNEGELYVFGQNEYQQLGMIQPPQSPVTKCAYFNDNNIVLERIAAGAWHNIVMDKKGICWGFGWSEYSQLGMSTTTRNIKYVGDFDVVAPIVLEISNNHPMESIYCGPWHSVLLTKTNEVYTFGYNEHQECSIRIKADRVRSPYWLKREEIGIDEDCVIDTVIPGYQSTLIVTRD